MKRLLIAASLLAASLTAVPALAQDIAITNVRIIVGSGQVIDSGTVIVRGGKIVSVTPGSAPTQGLRAIDAKGMSAMPGFIDSHKHVSNGDNAAGQARLLLEAGYTTVLAGGGQADESAPRQRNGHHSPWVGCGARLHIGVEAGTEGGVVACSAPMRP